MSLYGSCPKADHVAGTLINADLTDSSGGTPGATIAVIGATYDQAEVRNAVASLAAEIVLLKAELRKVSAIK